MLTDIGFRGFLIPSISILDLLKVDKYMDPLMFAIFLSDSGLFHVNVHLIKTYICKISS